MGVLWGNGVKSPWGRVIIGRMKLEWTISNIHHGLRYNFSHKKPHTPNNSLFSSLTNIFRRPSWTKRILEKDGDDVKPHMALMGWATCYNSSFLALGVRLVHPTKHSSSQFFTIHIIIFSYTTRLWTLSHRIFLQSKLTLIWFMILLKAYHEPNEIPECMTSSPYSPYGLGHRHIAMSGFVACCVVSVCIHLPEGLPTFSVWDLCQWPHPLDTPLNPDPPLSAMQPCSSHYAATIARHLCHVPSYLPRVISSPHTRTAMCRRHGACPASRPPRAGHRPLPLVAACLSAAPLTDLRPRTSTSIRATWHRFHAPSGGPLLLHGRRKKMKSFNISEHSTFFIFAFNILFNILSFAISTFQHEMLNMFNKNVEVI